MQTITGALRKRFRASPLNRRTLRLAIPVFLAMLSQTIIQVTDTAMVGVLGARELAAVGICGIAFWTLLALPMGFSMGVQAITARRFGEKNYRALGRILVSCAAFVIAFAALLTPLLMFYSAEIADALSRDAEIVRIADSFLFRRVTGFGIFFLTYTLVWFYNGLGKMAVGMVSSILQAVLNVVLNWVLIYGNLGAPELGTDGAAIASTLAGAGGMLLMITYAFIDKDTRSFFTGGGSPLDFSVLGEVMKVSLPPALDNVLTHISFLFFYQLADILGFISAASTNILISVMSIAFMPGFAFGITATTILGQAMGAGKFRLARHGTYRAALFAAVLMGILGLLFIAGGKNLLGLFTKDARVVNDAITALVLISLIQIADAYHMVLASALRGAGQVYWVLIAYFIIAFGVMLPIAYVLGIRLELGTTGLFLGLCVWIVSLAGIFLWKFDRGDWVGSRI